jgi:branched-chain amino acid transport system substrate-binding protein
MSKNFKLRRITIALIIYLILMVSLLVCESIAEAPVLKIGIQGVLSGELSAYGDRQKGGITFALSQAGDIKIGGQPVKIEIVYADDQGKAELGPIAAQQLIDAEVNVVIGPGFSGPTASAMPLFRQAKIPAVSPFTSANNLAEIGGGWYFRVSSRNDCQGNVLANIAKAMGTKKAVIIDDNEAYGADISKATAANLREIGVEVIGEYHGALGMIDWSPIIQRLRQDNPDVVIYNGYHTEAGRLFQQARERGISSKFLGSDGIAVPGIFKVADPAKLTNVSAIRMIPAAFVEGTASPEYKKFQEEYPPFAKSKGLSVTEADQYVAGAYDATNLLIDAVSRAGSTERQAIRGAILTTSFVGLTGPFAFEPNGERRGCRSSYFKLIGKEFKAVPMPQ